MEAPLKDHDFFVAWRIGRLPPHLIIGPGGLGAHPCIHGDGHGEPQWHGRPCSCTSASELGTCAKRSRARPSLLGMVMCCQLDSLPLRPNRRSLAPTDSATRMSSCCGAGSASRPDPVREGIVACPTPRPLNHPLNPQVSNVLLLWAGPTALTSTLGQRPKPSRRVASKAQGQGSKPKRKACAKKAAKAKPKQAAAAAAKGKNKAKSTASGKAKGKAKAKAASPGWNTSYLWQCACKCGFMRVERLVVAPIPCKVLKVAFMLSAQMPFMLQCSLLALISQP